MPRIVLAVLVLLVTGCGAQRRWQPSLVSHVPDRTPVRLLRASDSTRVPGVALDWERRQPRIVTRAGDTIVVAEGAKLEVRLKEKADHSKAGAIIGWAIGVAVSYIACPSPRRTCGEQDPTPLLGIGLGGLIGTAIRTDRWVRVRWDAP